MDIVAYWTATVVNPSTGQRVSYTHCLGPVLDDVASVTTTNPQSMAYSQPSSLEPTVRTQKNVETRRSTRPKAIADDDPVRIWPETCDICGETTDSRDLVVQHIQGHLLDMKECPCCISKPLSQLALFSHFMDKHTCYKQFDCLYCLKAFWTMEHLKRHEKRCSLSQKAKNS